jgi:TolA-binding protein
MLLKCSVLGLFFLAFFSSKSYASGDYGCAAPRGTIFFLGYESCNSVPFLSPSNDSRLNLELMLIDAGKLTGTLNTTTPQYYQPPPDFVSLRAPFDFDDWHVREPGLSATTDIGDGNSPSNSNDYAEGEGSRCNSAADGLEAFKNAVNAAGLPKEDAVILIEVRSNLVVGCSATTPPDLKPPQGLRSALARDFAAYIAGANAFYAGDFAAAISAFGSLNHSANPWLKETSSYMLGRTLLNSAQRTAFGEWGELSLDKVDKGNLKDAADAFNSYLRDFPQGAYAVSARGLLRRVYWLGGDQTRLAEAFDRALSDSEKGASNVTVLELVQEADAKLLGSVKIDQIQSPRFLAIIDLMSMRSGGPTAIARLTLKDLEAQKNRFATNPALYQYLLAAFHVHVDSKPEEALALLPNLPNAQLNYFAFSQQTLRVLAMDQSKQYDAERKLLLQMFPLAKMPLEAEQLQLELATLEVHTGHVDRIFVSGSPIRDRAIQTIVVEYIASAEILRQRIKDLKENTAVVDAALYTLLYKELTGGKYQAFQADLALVPSHPSDLLAPFVDASDNKGAEYQCSSLREIAATLERDGNDAKSLNCVGELVRINDVHYGQDNVPPATDLGGSDSMFPTTDYSRMDSYLKVIANQHAAADARAYALYRAVNCYAPSGYSECGKQNIPQSTRKQWFEMLHKEYANSIWAKSSKYYW